MEQKQTYNQDEKPKDLESVEQVENHDLDGEASKYNFKLDNYEGPLDLLLDLIKKSKMDIMDIQLALITDQYILHLNSLENLDLERATEFLVVAATLLEIKSKSVLPTEQLDLGEDDSERNLILQIQEYKLLKDASEKLQEQENILRFYKKPDDDIGRTHFVLPEFMQMQGLINAFVEVMARVDRVASLDEPKKIEKDRFTVAEKIAAIKDAIIIRKRIKFEQLFDENQTRGELINIFLALLELMKSQIICVEQRNIYGQIEIIAKEHEENESND